MRVSNAIVPAKGVFVEKNPGVAHSKGSGREIGGKHPPSAKRAAGRSAVEVGQFESSGAQPGCPAGVNDEQILVSEPEQARNTAGEFQELHLRRANGCDLPEDCSKHVRGRDHYHSIKQAGEDSPRQRCTLQWDVNPRAFFGIGFFYGLDADSSESRRRRRDLWDIENSWVVDHGFSQLIRRRLGGRPGKSRELDDLGSGLQRYGIGECGGRCDSYGQFSSVVVMWFGCYVWRTALSVIQRKSVVRDGREARQTRLCVARRRKRIKTIERQAQGRIPRRSHFVARTISAEARRQFSAPGHINALVKVNVNRGSSGWDRSGGQISAGLRTEFRHRRRSRLRRAMANLTTLRTIHENQSCGVACAAEPRTTGADQGES